MTARRVAAAQREAAQAAAPKTVAPKTVAPKTVAPKAVAPRIVARKIAASAATPHITPHITWGALGCPRETGLYLVDGLGQFPREADSQESNHESNHVHIRVKTIHIMAAENDPAALFTVVTFRPPHGPAEYVLGHRVA